MLGTIGFEHLEIPCVIGVYPSERKLEQKIFVDLKVEMDISCCIQTDRLRDTVDYVALAALCQEMAQNGGYQLIESYAHDVLATIFQKTCVNWAWIKIKKPLGLPSALYTTFEFELWRNE